MTTLIKRCFREVERVDTLRPGAKIVGVKGALIEAIGPSFALGTVCEIYLVSGRRVLAEVVGFSQQRLSLMLLENVHRRGGVWGRGLKREEEELRAGLSLYPRSSGFKIRVGEHLLGKVVNFFAESYGGSEGCGGFGRSFYDGGEYRSIFSCAPLAMERPFIDRPFATGVKAIDGLLTLGEGQRLGIFSGSGVGKSTLLAMLAKRSGADINVIALIGERGREVREFVDKQLGIGGLERSVVVVVGADEPPLAKVRGLYTATVIAEFFRDKGKKVLLLMDSLTRVALAQRNLGVSLREPPTTRGYPPSVFRILEELLERSGNSERGSITSFYTVLVEGDDFDEPITDAVRGILDGHIILRRKLANSGQYPAIDVPASVSRLMPNLVTKEQLSIVLKVKGWLSLLEDQEEIINLGAYVPKANLELDLAISKKEQLRDFLRQTADMVFSFEAVHAMLKRLSFTGS